MRNPEALRQVGRLFTILQRVSTRKEAEQIGRRQLAETCACSVKTVQRDIDHLQEMSVPIRYEDALGTYLLTDANWRLPAMQLAPSDLLALAVLDAWFGRQRSMFPFGTQISAVLRKTTAGLTARQRLVFDHAVNSVAEIGGLARNYSSAPIGDLITAIVNRQTIEMGYESRSSAPGRRGRRKVDPYRLDLRDGQYLELQAFCHTRREVRTFAVDRIDDLVVTDERFDEKPWEPHDEGAVGGLRGGKPIDLDVAFDAETASYAREHRWSFKPSFQDQPGGSVRMRGVVLGTEGVLNELLRWGRHAHVIGGAELRERIIGEIRALAKNYEDSPADGFRGTTLVSLGTGHNTNSSAQL